MFPIHVPQPPGGTISAPHIEAATHPFLVDYFAAAYVNVLHFDAGWRRVRVLAETPEGALRIACYHHYRGRDHHLVEPPAAPPEAAGA